MIIRCATLLFNYLLESGPVMLVSEGVRSVIAYFGAKLLYNTHFKAHTHKHIFGYTKYSYKKQYYNK